MQEIARQQIFPIFVLNVGKMLYFQSWHVGGGRDGHRPPEPESGRPSSLSQITPAGRPAGLLLIKGSYGSGPRRTFLTAFRTDRPARPSGRAYWWLPRCFSGRICGFWASPKGSGPGWFRTAADRSGPVQTTVSTAQRGNCYLIVAQVNYEVDGVLKFWNWTRNGRNHWCHLRDSSERINARLNKAKQ